MVRVVILEQHYLACLSQAPYLVGDEDSGVAAVVDPRRDVAVYVERARELGLEIRHVLLTHFHADFVSGHLELAHRTGATIHLGAEGVAEYEFHPLGDGKVLELGAVRIQCLSTPGHTPESVCYLVFDGPVGEVPPHAVLTGDTLFIGDVGRPDLMASKGITAEELAGQLFDSLHEKILTLPDETLVYPGHGAGSMCGKNLSTETVSTVGAQRAMNLSLQPMARSDFVARVTAGQPPAPAYFGYNAQLNKARRPVLEDSVARALQPLPLDRFLAMRREGARVLDTRSASAFAAGHLEGSVFIGLEGRFATWCGTLLRQDQPILVIANEGQAEEAVVRLGRIGFDHVVGFLDGSFAAVRAGAAEFIATVDRLDTRSLDGVLDRTPAPYLLDVRQPGETEQGILEGAVCIPLTELPARLDAVPEDRDILLYCATGYRSMIAASLLRATGRTRLTELACGYSGMG